MAEAQIFTLDKCCELRLEVEANADTYLKLKSGKAEIFGTEISVDQTVKCAGRKCAVFTWHGCVIHVVGPVELVYVWKETPMPLYLNLHVTLENARREADKNEHASGPTVMIMGPPNSGKSTLSHVLLNYAAKLGRKPLYVDMDLAEGETTLPGTMAIMQIDRVLDLYSPFDDCSPVVYHFGLVDPTKNTILFQELATTIGDIVARRREKDREARKAGVIINTCGLTKELAQHVRTALNVTTVVVLDSDRLFHEIQTAAGPANVVALPKSGGVLAKDEGQRERARLARVRQYFYGPRTLTLQPHAFDIPFDVVRIVKIGAPPLPASCLPLGAERPVWETQLVQVRPGPELLNTILSVSSVPPDWDQSSDNGALIHSSILGCVCVQNVDMHRRLLSILAPAPYPLPRTIFVTSDVRYVDS
eukprot:m.9773 g.9773  ORF g.9773 m.9773 type:complete len:419 (-) comp5472_c0_seq1:22-1278(-)